MMKPLEVLTRCLAICWTLPNTLLGLAVGLTGLLTGGRVQRRGVVVEFYGGAVTWLLDRIVPVEGGVMALTLGHTILGRSQTALDIARTHELVHVRQYERWGPLFIPAYLLASFWLWVRGRDPYRDNPFERAAYERDGIS
jgi:hypothetical protein